MSSTLYPVLESFPDAPSALARARGIMGELADWSTVPWPRLRPITTAEQYAYALRSFGSARMVADRDPVAVFPFLDELERRDAITFDAEQGRPVLLAQLRLSPGLEDLWPLPEGVMVSVDTTPPFGTPDSQAEDDCTEEELDRMVAVLGPLGLEADWDCAWRGVSETKDCGVLLCLNTEYEGGARLGEYVVWIRLGARAAWKPEGDAWIRDSGLALGEPRHG
ncbi:hypothetical protein ACVNF4_21295 [Streptomyces sp. S6]